MTADRGVEARVVQPVLELEGRERTKIFSVPVGTIIWPEKAGRGTVKRAFTAARLLEEEGEGGKVRGLTGFRALLETDLRLIYSGRQWHLYPGDRFGAFVKNLKEL